MLEKIKEKLKQLGGNTENVLAFAKSKKSIVATVVGSLLYLKQPPLSLMVCLTIITVAWIAAQTVVDLKGKAK